MAIIIFLVALPGFLIVFVLVSAMLGRVRTGSGGVWLVFVCVIPLYILFVLIIFYGEPQAGPQTQEVDRELISQHPRGGDNET